MKNHIVGIMACQNEPPISSYTITESSEDLKEITVDTLSRKMVEALKKYDGEILEGVKLDGLQEGLSELDETAQEEAYRQMKTDAEEVWNYAGFGKKEKKAEKK